MIGQQARPCRNLFWYVQMIQCGSSRLGCISPVHSFCWFSEPFLGDFVGAISRPFFGIWWEIYAWPPRGSFQYDSTPKSVSKVARFWGFRCSRVRGVLSGISSIPNNLASFGAPKLGYGMPMRCSYYPQSLAQIHGAIREIGSWIWGSWPAGAVHPERLSLTGLTGAPHRSDRCKALWVLPRVNVLVSSLLSRVAAVSSLGQFGAQ
jgi:hypothetical protein